MCQPYKQATPVPKDNPSKTKEFSPGGGRKLRKLFVI
jgi:hypothetical protein